MRHIDYFKTLLLHCTEWERVRVKERGRGTGRDQHTETTLHTETIVRMYEHVFLMYEHVFLISSVLNVTYIVLIDEMIRKNLPL